MILLFILCAAAAGWGGWRLALWLNNKKNEVNTQATTYLKHFIEDLKSSNQYWKEQSTYNKEIQNSTITNHNKNINQTLETLLNLLQRQNKETMKEGEREQVENIIKTIKSGISSSKGHE